MTLVVDASVLVKLVLPEPDSDRAVFLRERESSLIAPVLLIAEVANAVWKRARLGELDLQDATEATATAIGLMSTLHPLEDLAARAMRIAMTLNHPVYDCFYLALAEREDVPLITADRRLSTAAAALGTIKIAKF